MTTNSWLDELCSSAFMPHGQCYLWDVNLLRLHGISDAIIALAYFSIPAALLYVVRKRNDLPYPAIFILFGSFIIACGTTHLMEVVTIWHPYYWLSGSIKAFTAAISLVTAVVLWRSIPHILMLPSPADLKNLNLALEEKVRGRTADLIAVNEDLRREIVQRQDAEQEVSRLNASLQHRLDEMKILFDLLPVGVGIANDATGSDIRANRALAQMLAQSTESNVSLTAPADQAPVNFKILINGLELAPDKLPMQTALRENRPVLDVEETIVRSDGTKIIALANAVPLQDADGHCRGCVATFQDITARTEMEHRKHEIEHKLQDTQKLESLGVLAGGIAHDFNNLLTGILGNASLARMELAKTSPVVAYVEQIETASRRAAELCQQMLAYSGKGRFVVQPIDLNELVENTTHLLTISIAKNCVLRLNLAARLPAVVADATQIRQIVMNLVINASEAIGDRSGVIAVTTGVILIDQDYLATLIPPVEITPNEYVFLEVSDNGNGMNPDTMRKIFDPFFTTKFTGRGLGLAAVLGIIRGHKGALKVYSEPGRGTTFKMLLPLAPATEQANPPVAPLPPSTWRGHGTVLVVDDEAPVRLVSTRMLQALGFSTEQAEDGREAVEKYRSDPSRYVLVLLDLTMPHLDGEATFRQLRHLNPGVKVVLMSGFNEQDAVGRFAGKGLAGFVQKPFELDAILNAVRRVLLET